MATRKKAGRASSKKNYRFSAESLQDSLRQSQGASSISRKDFIYNPKEAEKRKGFTIRLLPAIAVRGANKLPLYYYAQAQHWTELTSEDGQTFPAGITCWDYMRKEQPTAFSNLTPEVQKGAKCRFCEFLEESQDEDGEYLPHIEISRFGKPDLAAQMKFNTAVLLPEEEYTDEDPHTVKMFPCPPTVIAMVDELLSKHYPDLLDPEVGNWIDVKLGRDNRYSIQPHPNPTKVWYEAWEKDLPDLEEVSPRFMSYEDQCEHVKEHYAPKNSSRATGRKKKAGRSPSRKAVAKRVRRTK